MTLNKNVSAGYIHSVGKCFEQVFGHKVVKVFLLKHQPKIYLGIIFFLFFTEVVVRRCSVK